LVRIIGINTISPNKPRLPQKKKNQKRLSKTNKTANQLAMNNDDFQPTLLGTSVVFEEGDTPGLITDETPTQIFIESELFTGWTSKAFFLKNIEPF
jgi:hypothetical protein